MDKSDQQNRRAETARQNDDSDLIDTMEDAPAFSGASGGELQRNIGSQAEAQHGPTGEPGVTRVRNSDKKEEADLPRYNER